MQLVITPMYGALLAILFLILSVRVILARRTARVTIGDGGDLALLRRQRVQANFAEYVPLVLVLMVCAELGGSDGWQIHAIGGLLLVGRAIHAVSVSRVRENVRWRVVAMMLTFASLIGGALASLGASSGFTRSFPL